MEKLSGFHAADAAGLPRGKHSLLPHETRELQHRRIVRAAITAFAEEGYHTTTISSIVKNARVSRQVFYDLFSTKEECFLAAEKLGREGLMNSMAPSMIQQGVSIEGDSWLRTPIKNYLQICTEEPLFARAWTLEFPNATPRTLAQRNAFFIELATLFKFGHQLIRVKEPDHWLPVPDAFYEAAIGGAFELIFRCISQNRFQDLPLLEDTLVHFILTTLGYKFDT